MYRQLSTTQQNSSSKLVGQYPRKATAKKRFSMEYLPGLPKKIPSHREAALKTERRCFSKVIMESNVTPNITRSSDYFIIVLPIVNAGDWGCIVRDLETIIILLLLAFNFIPQRSHHSLTSTRSQLRDSTTVTLMPEDGTTPIKVESSAKPIRLFPRKEKSSEVYRRNNNGRKTRPTALLTCFNQFTPRTIHHNIL